MKVIMEMNQVLTERSDFLNNYLEQFFLEDFLEFLYFVTDGSFTADGGLLLPTGGLSITPQMTCFRSASVQ